MRKKKIEKTRNAKEELFHRKRLAVKTKNNEKKKKKKKKIAKHEEMTCKETTRRADEDDSEWRGTEMVATYKYPDLVKGCVVDRCPGPIMTFPRKKI